MQQTDMSAKVNQKPEPYNMPLTVPAPSGNGVTTFTCRFCDAPLKHLVVDLGMQPLCESYVTREHLNDMEPFYPVQAFVCECCFLVQVPELVSGENIYSHYAYFSSYSDSWLQHAKNYSEMIIKRFNLNEKSQVVEVASNDGYLLQYFIEKGIPVLGIEPAANIVEVAAAKGIPCLVKFFGENTAREVLEQGKRADLLVGNNVLAHVPDLNDFVKGLKLLLNSDGVITMEFSHLMRLMEGNQFDQIYQEHYCYYSFLSVQQVFSAHGLTIFDVEELLTHGGSIRIYARHTEDESKPILNSVTELYEREVAAGYAKLETYHKFTEQVAETKRKLLEFLIQAKREGKRIAGYGAPGKGNTLLNYCGVREDFVDYTVDRNPFKHGKFLPGTHIPIYAPEKIAETKPDYVLILPWNLKDEIMKQLSYVREWGGKFVIPIPELTVFS